MDPITSLQQLIDTLDECDPQDYVKVASKMNIPKKDFEDYIFWNDDSYARNCIERTEVYELILICWKPGDKTAVHGHDDQKCWVYQVDGAIHEERFKEKDGALVSCHNMPLTPGKLSYMEDNMGFHCIDNRSNENAMSLHLYISPIDHCQVFNSKEDKFCEKKLKYDSFKGVVAENMASSEILQNQ
jgi:cysteine dioxygenase